MTITKSQKPSPGRRQADMRSEYTMDMDVIKAATAKRKRQVKSYKDFAQKLMEVVARASADETLLLGNLLVEESGLHGGPLGDVVAEFGEALCLLGMKRLSQRAFGGLK